MSDIPIRDYFEKQLESVDRAVQKAEQQFDRHIVDLDRKIHDLESISIKTAFFVSMGTSIAVGVIIFLVGHYIVKP